MEGVELNGEVVPGFVVPAVHIPEHTIEVGCIIEHDAPGGCLGAVEITGFEIPPVEIPGFEIPAFPDADDPYAGETVDGDRAEGEVVEGDSAEQECQQEPAEGDTYVGSVYRPSVYRPSGYRASLYRASGYRPTICVRGECTNSVSVPSMSVPSVSVASASVPSDSIASYTLEGSEAEVIEDDDQTAYLAPADILFDFDEAELRPDAVPTLQAIVDEIAAQFPEASLTVEGHTDDVGSPEYNQQLSEDRAAEVAEWLTTEGGIAADRITTRGYGETAPAAPNAHDDGSDDPEGRAVNRRVVITAHTG